MNIADTDTPWQHFLAELERTGRFQHHHLSVVRRFFSDIRDRVGDHLPLPLTQPSPDGALQLAWESKDRRFIVEIDIFDDGTFDWFFRDRTTKGYDGTDIARIAEIPSKLINYLTILTVEEGDKNMKWSASVNVKVEIVEIGHQMNTAGLPKEFIAAAVSTAFEFEWSMTFLECGLTKVMKKKKMKRSPTSKR